MMILLADARGTVRRSRLQRSDRLLHEDPAFAALSESDIKRIIFEQTLIVELQPDAALTKLVSLLPDVAEAERALAAVEAVAGPVEEMEERTIAMFARMREALGCQVPALLRPERGGLIMKGIKIEEAVAMIPDGASLMVGGFMGVGTSERVMDELVRQGKRGLTVIANDTARPGIGIGKLIDAGRWRSVIVSHIGTNPKPSGR